MRFLVAIGCLIGLSFSLIGAGISSRPADLVGRRAYTFLVIGDPHYNRHPTRLEGVLRYLKTAGIQVDAVICEGDLNVNSSGSLDSLLVLRRDSLTVRIPLYSAPGNHDLTLASGDAATTLDSTDAAWVFRTQQREADYKGFYFVDWGNCRFIFVPNSVNVKAERCSVNARTYEVPGYVYAPLAADSGETQFAVVGSPMWSATMNALDTAPATIEHKYVVDHHPLRNVQFAEDTGDWAWGQYDRAYGDSLVAHGCEALFAGHEHQYARFRATLEGALNANGLVEIIGPNVDVARGDSTYADTLSGTYIAGSLAKWNNGDGPVQFGLLEIRGPNSKWTVMDTLGTIKDRAEIE